MPIKQFKLTFNEKEVESIYIGSNNDYIKIEEYAVPDLNDEYGDISYHIFIAKDKENNLWRFSFRTQHSLFSAYKKHYFYNDALLVKKYSRVETKYLTDQEVKWQSNWRESE